MQTDQKLIEFWVKRPEISFLLYLGKMKIVYYTFAAYTLKLYYNVLYILIDWTDDHMHSIPFSNTLILLV